MMWLRQSTTINIKLGPAVSQSDAVTEKTALSPTVNLTKAGGTIAARSSATAIAHDANGWYTVELNTTDTNTLGRLQVYFRDPTNQLPVWDSYMVVPAVVYDAMVAGSDNLDVSVVQLGGVVQSLTDLKDFADTGYDPATHKVEGVKLADVITTYTGDTPQTGDSFARIGATGSGLTSLASAANLATLTGYVDTEIASLITDVGTLLTRLSSVRAGYLDNLSAGAVAQASALTTVAGYVDTEVAGLVTDMATVLSRLTSARAGYLDNLSAGAVAQASALATVAGYIDTEVAGLVTDMATVLSRLSAARSGYLDNLSAGAVALNADIATLLSRITAAVALDSTVAKDATVAKAATVATAASIADLNNIAASDVLTQVNAALDAAIAELTGVSSATPSLRTGLMLLYMNLRNRTDTTASAETIKNSAGTTIATAALSDDGTTFTKAKFA